MSITERSTIEVMIGNCSAIAAAISALMTAEEQHSDAGLGLQVESQLTSTQLARHGQVRRWAGRTM